MARLQKMRWATLGKVRDATRSTSDDTPCPRCGARTSLTANPYFRSGDVDHQYFRFCRRCDTVLAMPDGWEPPPARRSWRLADRRIELRLPLPLRLPLRRARR